MAGTRTSRSTSPTRRSRLVPRGDPDRRAARGGLAASASTRTPRRIRPLAAEFERRDRGRRCPRLGTPTCTTYETGTEVATRNASQDAIQALAPHRPELFGGAADLSESNLTDVKGEANFSADEPGRNIRFGVREHAMGGIGNGIAYHGGFIPYVATFLTFSDYMRGCRAAVGAVRAARHLRLDARLRRARRGRARPTSRSSTTPRCARSRTSGSSDRATPTRRAPHGRWRSSGGTGRWRWH